MKRSALGGIALAIAGIAVGLYLDGGKIGQLLQPTAALIVIGGTLGAVMVQFPLATVMEAAGMLKEVFLGVENPAPWLISELSRYAAKARRDGVVALDAEIGLIRDPFLRRCITLAVDGVPSEELRYMMEASMESEMERETMLPRVFEAAGGFAPTIGILGAIIGLIQVMQKMENINEVGKGIAVAFVATIYGVGVANLFLLPCAGRIRLLIERRDALRAMMLEGVLGVVHSANPRALEQKLAIYANEPARVTPVVLVH